MNSNLDCLPMQMQLRFAGNNRQRPKSPQRLAGFGKARPLCNALLLLPAILTILTVLMGADTIVTEPDPLAAMYEENLPGANAIEQNMFDTGGSPAREIRDYYYLLLGIIAIIFVFVWGVLLYTIFRFRARKEDEGKEPPQNYGSDPVEVAWTVAPMIIVFILFLITLRSILVIDKTERPPDSVHVRVIGHQWWWEFIYPEIKTAEGLPLATANELHIPAGKDIWCTLESQDVIHSFWLPSLFGKKDCVPNHENFIWFHVDDPGWYDGQCVEYCGAQHANMLIRAYAHETEESFNQWVEKQSRNGNNFNSFSQFKTWLDNQTKTEPAYYSAQLQAWNRDIPNWIPFRDWLATQKKASDNETIKEWLADAKSDDAKRLAAQRKKNEQGSGDVMRWTFRSFRALMPNEDVDEFSLRTNPPDIAWETIRPWAEQYAFVQWQIGHDDFAKMACINCHTIRQPPGITPQANGIFGPDLTHLMSRTVIGSGAAANTPRNLLSWVQNPQVIKQDCLMPDMRIPEDHIWHVVGYLRTLRYQEN